MRHILHEILIMNSLMYSDNGLNATDLLQNQSYPPCTLTFCDISRFINISDNKYKYGFIHGKP